MYIIATVGVNTKDSNVLLQMINSGVNVIRLNTAHGNKEEFNNILNIVRGYNNGIHILQDLSGSKIRVSDRIKDVIRIFDKEEVLFCGEDIYRDSKLRKVIPLNINNNLLTSNNIERISMKDNTMKFRIKKKDNSGILAEVIKGGVVRGGKGCNIKGIKRNNILSIKDKGDLRWAINNNIDIICQSFVEKKEDINNVKLYIQNNSSNYKPKIWAKVESSRGINNIHEIAESCDGIVVGRGDLIPETSLTSTPYLQERVINKAKDMKIDIILATHILDSMKNGRDPDLPEVESIYNNIKKGVNGFLLAGETSVGKRPINTVKFLNTLIGRYI